ncbi:hypothetical protein SZN_21471 [Streptomyces zinciresistens K42]|uniref:Galactose mutarotase n=1 Tax=Streptomyces zinciresistens K42 TaxID=700597 RepID=G2GFL0_9ACTN|nr:hypothetical protein [Streptomyces zinciresistens]EGX57705.1 hypothetical protein SZN_21471 [Streptomyces zinciresistens K42]
MLTVTTDPGHGGRWTSLRSPAREWLWHRPAPERGLAAPGDAFADAGGLEECVPTVRGLPDHGDVWARAWTVSGETQHVGAGSFTLARTLTPTAEGVAADYTLTAAPGFRFVWAAHALLDLSADATLHMPPGAATRLFPEAAPLLPGPWPPGAPWVAGAWPAPHGVPMDRLGPDDGTAVGAVVDADLCCVHDGDDRLALLLRADRQPVSTALWRNLAGFPPERPYRSTGVEPMLGRVFDLADAGPGDAARVPATGEVRWRLTLTPSCRCPEPPAPKEDRPWT